MLCFVLLTTVFLMVAGSGCKKEEFKGRTAIYNLNVKDVLGVSGTATFTETSSNATIIDIMLIGASSGDHPAELCDNSAIEGGPVKLTLTPVDGNGNSSTAVTSLNYDQLVAYDGFIRVRKSSGEPDVIIAQGDIGGNVFTGTNISYPLDTIGTYDVSGSALFEERVNGSTLVTITLTGSISGQQFPATINLGSIASVGGGPVVCTLSDVNGTTGKSYTNIRKLNSGITITYDNWLVYDGYINIYQNSVSYDNIICHGDIGSN